MRPVGQHAPPAQPEPTGQQLSPQIRSGVHGGRSQGAMQRGSSPSEQQPLFGVSQK
jgi:hypothetical protein